MAVYDFFYFGRPDRLKLALSRITQDYDQWTKQQTMASSPSSASYAKMDVTPAIPASTIFGHPPNTSLGLKVNCILEKVYHCRGIFSYLHVFFFLE